MKYVRQTKDLYAIYDINYKYINTEPILTKELNKVKIINNSNIVIKKLGGI